MQETEKLIHMRKICALVADALDELYDFVKVGISTNEINEYIVQYAKKHNVINAPLGYRGFPKSICTSINDVICHGIPSDYKLKDGDFLNIDITFIDKQGWHGDSARMYFVGDFFEKKNLDKKKLTSTAYHAMMHGINAAKPGNRLSDIGSAIQNYTESFGYSVVREFCGHGIGKKFHQEPNILHYVPHFFRNTDKDIILTEGMTFTIEPMINAGGWRSKIMNDNWTAKTKDGSLSAQFEHTIYINDKEAEILTLSKNNRHFPKEIIY